MPTITFSYADFQELLGKKLDLVEFKNLALLYAKAEVDGVEGDEIKLSLDDTNLPSLWCVEGLARLFKGVLGVEKGPALFETHASTHTVIVEPSVKKTRPHIAVFVADGKTITEPLLLQLIQLQEKFCEGYGLKRSKVSIGLYNYVHIAWPVHYKAAIPESVRFAPLDMEKELNLREILEQHPKGQQYQGILNDMARYPVLTDSAGQVLSLVPIINSNFTGKLEVGSTSLMFEATGTDENAVDLAANIFAQNLHDRGFSISRATIDTGKRYTTPRSLNQKIRINPATVAQLTGLVLTKNQIRSRLEKARYGVQGPVVHVPHYRHDIMHITDVIEDIAIMHGFDKIESAPLQHYTLGAADAMVPFVDAVREIGVGLGFQEVFSAVLSNKDMLYTRMNIKDTGTVEIENTMSETYAAVRSWLLPIMLEVLSKNKHVDYPQKVFEQGLVTERHGADARDGERIAFAISHTATDFTEIKQVLDAVLLAIGKEHTIIPIEHGSFISGRCGEVSVEGKKIAILGEIHPAVLVNWGLEMPVSALEINLTELKKLLSI